MTQAQSMGKGARDGYRLGRHGRVACLIGFSLVTWSGAEPATAASGLGQEPGVGVLLISVVFALLGYLSALALHSVVRVIMAGLMLLAVLLLAHVMGVTVLQPEHLWHQLSEVLPLLSAIGGRLASVLALQITPVLAAVYLVGLGVGLLGLRRLI
ncbi:MAG TPA: hypothetical protein VI542_10210 [Candidatus Tectomicrobia bacterium]